MEDDLPRGFLGVWIPREVWLHRELTLIQKCLFSEIDSLDTGRGCTASNEHFARLFGASVTTISTSISRLIALGYVEQAAFDGRTRILHSMAGFQKLKGRNPAFQNLKGSHSGSVTQRSKSRKAIHESTSENTYIENGNAPNGAAEPDPEPTPEEVARAIAELRERLHRELPNPEGAAAQAMIREEVARQRDRKDGHADI